MNKNLILSLGLIAFITAPAFAQEAQPVASRAARQQTVAKVTAKMAEETGAKILVTYSLTQQAVTAPDAAATPATLEESLTALVRRLPDATWAKVYLPAPTDGRPYKADAVAQFAQAEIGLFGRLDKTQTNLVSLLGKRMTAEQAQPYIKDLGLEPYYVLMSRRVVMGSPTSTLAGFGDPAGKSTAAINALLKQLGATSPRDIPTGEYDVTIPGDNGTPQKVHLKIENSEGKTAIMVRTDSNP